ncbi:hypothetical protein POM88_018043 [Heracleum sosnowskyi]|uniref:Replication protein A OB domain-containing protein n=1 Tax=Heracleum sosnowskyi TaxID=360622 RepID=A0AAD8MUD8_9APIA|nr:hypothetical protein POM88_018043 [Heracleum sosnowskyi]
MWPSISSSDSKNALKGYNLILLDEDNHHIQAFVYADNWKAFSNDIEEVEKVQTEDFMIPKHKFEFMDLSELFNIASNYKNPENPEFSTDIIGALENYEREKIIDTTFGKRNIAKFRITDGRYSHKVTIWGQLALKTDELFLNAEELPIIVIVTSTKLKIFKNSVQISTLPSSKIYLNLDNDVVHSMRLRLEEEGYISHGNTTSEPLPTLPPPIIQTVTLKELGEKSDSDDAKNIPVAEKKYKIVVLAGDSTEAFNFVLADKAARRLIGQTATKLISDGIKNNQTDIYPSTIKEIVGKECIFTVEMSDDNLLIQSKIFKVKVARDTSIATPSASQATLASGSNSSYADNIIELSNFAGTPGSVKSSAKKIKTVKNKLTFLKSEDDFLLVLQVFCHSYRGIIGHAFIGRFWLN